MLEGADIQGEDVERLQNGLEDVISRIDVGKLMGRLQSLRVDPHRYSGLEKVR